MAKRKIILVTGGAGFVGSHLVDALVARGERVRVLDSLERQVHGGRRPTYLNKRADYRWGDVANRALLKKALQGVDRVFYLAAAVGVGQSMYEVDHYIQKNTTAAGIFWQTVIDLPASRRPKKMVVASSMSIYGEGAYRCARCGPTQARLRPRAQLTKRQWECRCDTCGGILRPRPTPESHPLRPTSVYAVTKRDHEELFIALGQAYQIPTVAMRFFNIYGTRQALSNPYTGILAIFSSRVLNGNPPLIFEDGRQSRDFTHVSDIVRACLLAMDKPKANYQVYNVGTGHPTTVLDVARRVQDGLHCKTGLQVVRRFREGDIRHCYGDISKIQKELGFRARMTLAAGLAELLSWVRTQRSQDRVTSAARQLHRKGLAH